MMRQPYLATSVESLDGCGATQGPGLTLTYNHTKAWSFSLNVRSEKVRFMLDGVDPAPDNVDEDSSSPVVLSIGHEPKPYLSFTGFAGAEFDGALRLDDSTGTPVKRQSYDTAPSAGLAFCVLF